MASAAAESSAVGELQERLNDPRVAESLCRLLDQLDVVAFAVEALDGFLRRGDTIADSLSQSVTELTRTKSPQLSSLVQSLPKMAETGAKLADTAAALDLDAVASSNVLERLSEPDTLRALDQLLDRMPLAAFLLRSLEEFISRGDTIAENLAAAVGDLKLGSGKLDIARLQPLFDALPKLSEGLPKIVDAGVSMVNSGMLDKDMVGTLGDLGKKSAETYNEVAMNPVPPVGGLFAVLRATKDPDVQKSMGFFFAFAKAFAKHLK